MNAATRYLRQAFAAAAFLCAAAFCSCGDPFEREYRKEFRTAVEYFTTSGFAAVTDTMRLSHTPEFIYSIVAPEVIIYTRLKDRIETHLTAILYISRGAGYGDFSVGRFQMKPSFAESVETHIWRNPELWERYNYCVVRGTDERAGREERMRRLMDDEWQMRYIAVVTEIIRSRFAGIEFGSMEEELAFYATAYNGGFLNSESYIRSRTGLKLFPRFSKKKYNYASVSAAVYGELAKSRNGVGDLHRPYQNK